MNKLLSHIPFIIIISLLIVINGCGLLDLNSTTDVSEKSGVIALKVVVQTTTDSRTSTFPVLGSQLQIDQAFIAVNSIVIEENSSENDQDDFEEEDQPGYDGEQDGEHDDGDNDSDDDVQSGFDGEQEGDNDDGDVDEDEDDDIVLLGPFTIDISEGEVEIAVVEVPVGIYRNVDFTFSPSIETSFNGNSILISGIFFPDDGTETAFTLSSQFEDEIQTEIANGGIVVGVNTTTSIVVIFDLVDWFRSVDFSTADITDGQLLVDNVNNIELLATFENALEQTVDAGEQDEDDDSDDQDPSYNCSITVPEPEPLDLFSLALITVDQAAQSVLAAYSDATIVEVELDNENGCLVYSIELSNGLEVKVTLAPVILFMLKLMDND